jgi:hypothetical protein
MQPPPWLLEWIKKQPTTSVKLPVRRRHAAPLLHARALEQCKVLRFCWLPHFTSGHRSHSSARTRTRTSSWGQEMVFVDTEVS